MCEGGMTKEDSLHIVYDFYRQLRQISRAIEWYRNKVLNNLPLTGPQLYILYSINRLEQCTNSELSKFSGLAKNSVTSFVKFLAKEGYIYQSHKDKDGRIVTLSVSEKGKEMLNQMVDCFELEPGLLNFANIISERIVEDESTFILLNKLLNDK